MFQKKPAHSARPIRSQTEAMAGSTFSVFGADITVKGDVHATADLHIDGHIEGDITCASLVQGEGSEIVGAITADAARLAGTVRGTITVAALMIVKSAHIHGDVHYDTLTIEQGAEVEGRFAQRRAGAQHAEGEPRLMLAN